MPMLLHTSFGREIGLEAFILLSIADFYVGANYSLLVRDSDVRIFCMIHSLFIV